MLKLKKIITGGQTGVDQLALEFAIDHKIQIGGFCPKGRRCESGLIPIQYELVETKNEDYWERTQLNIKHSDGTLILFEGITSGGTQYTVEYCNQIQKPIFSIDLLKPVNELLPSFSKWLASHNIKTLNIAGPRASEGISSVRVKYCLHCLLENKEIL